MTYRYERRRAVAAGVLETAAHTFLLLIAVRWYEAGAVSKAVIASGGSLGLLLSPGVVAFVEAKRWTTAEGAYRLAAVGAAAFAVMAAIPSLFIFVLGSAVALAAASAAIPLVTQIYQENYPDQERGRRFSRTLIIRIGVAAFFSDLVGRALSHDGMRHFRLLLVVFSVAAAMASLCFYHCPANRLTASGSRHPFRGFQFVTTDRLFRQTLICWMLMGFANLMMFPMRVEYLANEKYGLALTIDMIAFLTGVVPNLARLVMSPIWGWLFDHMNFFALRMTLNLGFALGILTFFTTTNLKGMILGALIFGISNAGGDVAWSLWVTKFAPPARVADYMSVHTFLTGFRGVIAPLVAFQAIKSMPMQTLGSISAVLIVLATALMLPEIKYGHRARPAAPATVDEVPE